MGKRYDATFKWLSKIIKELVQIEKSGGMIFDEDGDQIAQLEITSNSILTSSHPDECVVLYEDGWVDEESITKKYWRQKLSKWRVVRPEHVEKINCRK